MQRYSKYGNRKTEIHGRRFDSRAEARRYDELKLMESAGLIFDLRCQPRYELQPAFVDRGRRVAAISYLGDFEYREGEQLICEDVKGARTTVFALKAKLFRFRYPQIELRIVDA